MSASGQARGSRTRRLLLALAMVPALAGAAEAVDLVPDASLEERVRAVSLELRCLVCQNQSLADSHADLALDLKQQVREQLRAGRSDEQVLAYMTERYGDFVRYRPAWHGRTLVLWLGPFALLLGLGWLAWRQLAAHVRLARRAAPKAQTQTQTQAQANRSP